jgi:hypothetical protein
MKEIPLETANPKPQALNPKQIQNPNFKSSKLRMCDIRIYAI